jgi:Rod binding domain-containing protein
MSAGLPPIDQSLLPADVRNGGPERRKQYDAALGFERQLLSELTKTLAATAKPADGDDADAATKTYLDMLPGTLADALVANGGIGLAEQLMPPAGTTTGGTSS